MNKSFAVTTMIALTLSACGGSSEPKKPIVPMTISIDQSDISIEEGIPYELVATVENPSSTLNVTASVDNNASIDYSVTESQVTFTITPNDVLKDSEATAVISIADEDDSFSASIPINIVNASALLKIEQLTLISELVNSPNLFDDELRIHNSYTELAKLSGNISMADFNAKKVFRKSFIENYELQLCAGCVVADITVAIDDYNLDRFDETSLDDALARNLSILNESVTPIVNDINSIASTSALPQIGEASYIASANATVSLFIGNLEMGQFNENKWVFNENYSLLSSLVDTGNPSNLTCEPR